MTKTFDLKLLREALLIQCRFEDVQRVKPLVSGRRSGIVLTGRDSTALRAVAHDRDAPELILADASAYSGKKRSTATDPFDETWLQEQRSLGFPVLPNAGYIAAADTGGLKSILSRTAGVGSDAIAPLAVNSWWLDEAGGLDVLQDEIEANSVPVAFVLEHLGDPLSVRRSLSGILRILEASTVPIIVLRCDISSIGLLCHGSYAAAVGTTTGLRHNYPITNSPGGGRPARIAAIVKQCLSYVAVEKIAFAVAADPENQMWICECRTCLGQTLDWITLLPTFALKEAAAFSHSIEVLLDLRDDLLSVNSDLTMRRRSWSSCCDNALFQLEDVSDLSGPWREPRMLTHWTALSGPLRERVQ